MVSPFTEDYHDGDVVQCQRCAKNAYIKFFGRDAVVIVSTQEQQTLALRCRYCGYVMCDSCAHPADSLFPICPSCQREWGPYYFTHDAISPSSPNASFVGSVPPAETPQPLPVPQEIDAPSASAETLGAGEVDFLREDLGRNHEGLLRKVLTLLLMIVLLAVVALSAFGPGRPLIKKGLKLLSSRPTRSPSSMSLIMTPTGTTTIQSSLSTPKVTPAPIGFSPTSALSPEAKLIGKAGLTPSPTQKSATATNTMSPTATNTPVPPSITTTAVAGDCIPALSITLDDVGKILCVTGTVEYTTQNDNAFSIYFSREKGYFRIVVYDRVPKGIDNGVCIKVTGEVKALTGIPVIAPGFNDAIEICSP